MGVCNAIILFLNSFPSGANPPLRAAEVSEELLSPVGAVGKEMHPTYAWGSFQPLFLQGKLSPGVLGKTQPRIFNGSSEIQPGHLGSADVGFFPPISLPTSRDNNFCAPKVNIPDRSFASDHKAAAKSLSNCSTVGFCC